MKKPFLILGILVAIIIGLFAVRTVVSNKISTSGVELGSAQEQIEHYKSENVILKEKILGLSSLNHVSSKAAEMGFVESKSTMAISAGVPLARSQ